jgi:hypothetical protein
MAIRIGGNGSDTLNGTNGSDCCWVATEPTP